MWQRSDVIRALTGLTLPYLGANRLHDLAVGPRRGGVKPQVTPAPDLQKTALHMQKSLHLSIKRWIIILGLAMSQRLDHSHIFASRS